MRYLLILDFTLAAFGAAMAVAVGFVALVFTIYRHESERLQAGLPSVLAITACFVGLLLIAGTAGWLLRKRQRWHWPVQALLALSLPVFWQIIIAHLQGS